jgi:hypothetical protein
MTFEGVFGLQGDPLPAWEGGGRAWQFGKHPASNRALRGLRGDWVRLRMG